MPTAMGALKALDFGQVDSESEPDLEHRFVRTADFDRFLDPANVLILGPKGSGKSALFEMFAKHLPSTHKLAKDRLQNVLIATGTGFGDVTEITTTDIQSFKELGEFQYDSLWKLYIALKLAMELGRLGYNSDGPLRDFLRATRRIKDYRIGPMMKSGWQLIAGNAPEELEINVMGTGARIKSGRGSLDVLDLLADIQHVLRINNRRIWLLFDKIDEIHPTDTEQRDRALEGLFPAVMQVQRTFPNIVPRIFIRSDLYGPQLKFTNKSHLVDKQFEIDWDHKAIQLLLAKRGVARSEVREYLETKVPALAGADPESLRGDELQQVLETIFDARAYPGPKEAQTLSWMTARATDAKGSTFPREMILYGNISRQNQLKKGGPGEASLITGRAVVEAYYEVSRIRCQTYLSEFPDLEKHIKRFRGNHDAPFTRAELLVMFQGLDPEGDDAIERLYEVGVLAPERRADVTIAEAFDVPRLYRAGLGLAIIARP
jgi:energy-coupling factor transporter ATP-binding protein EcfA2